MWLSDSAALRSHFSETHHEDSHRTSPAESTFSNGIQLPRFAVHEQHQHPINPVVVFTVSDRIESERLDTPSRVPDTSNAQKDNAPPITERFTHMNTSFKSLAFVAALAACIASAPAHLNAQ